MTISQRRSSSAAASSDRETPNQAKNNNNNSLVKPTEAQLRYAQFHHKRRAQAVKHRIDRLHQTPVEVVVTIGKINMDIADRRESAASDDNDDVGGGYSSVDTKDTSDVEVKAIRLRRPKISEGRRAFLKASKRLYRRRRREIQQNGYRGYFLEDDEEEDYVLGQGEETEGDFASETDEHTDHEPHHPQKQGEDEETAPNFSQVFATLPKQHPNRRRRRKKGGKSTAASKSKRRNKNNDESYQRFQAACHAMMRNIQTSQTKAALPSIAVPSKRWRRSKAHVDASKAQQQTDFYRYKTSGFVAGRKASTKNAALLLSYSYFQQNKSVGMDTGATWLTHLPAKQSKRAQSNNYYFSDIAELPHLIQQASSFDEQQQQQEDWDDNESTSTLAMRKPGPQKFHRLMAYVQHRLIEKEKKQEEHQKQLLMISMPEGEGALAANSKPIGQSRTRELAEQLLSPLSHDTTPSRIQQMADSIEGKGGTPKMKLHTSTPFSGMTSSQYSYGSQQQQQHMAAAHRLRKKRKSKYVPRMRLREFAVEKTSQQGGDGDGDGQDAPTPLPRTKLSERFVTGDASHEGTAHQIDVSSSPPRTMKLRDSLLGEQEEEGPSTSRTREMALALEGEPSQETGDGSKFQQIRDSLEPKNATPTMKLRGDFDRIDEKKADEGAYDNAGPMSRSAVDRLSRQFESPPTEEVLEDFNKSRPSRHVMDEFSKHIDPRIYEQFDYQQQQQQQQVQRASYGSDSNSSSHRKSGGSHGMDKRQSTGSNVTEFFARIRGEQQQRQKEQQHKQVGSSGAAPVDSVVQPESPSGQSDALSDLTKGSNLTGLWNRGRNSILNTIAETQAAQKGGGGAGGVAGLLSPEVIGKATSGLFHNNSNNNNNNVAEHQGQTRTVGLLSPEVIGKATSGLFNKFRGVPEESSMEEEAQSVPFSTPVQSKQEASTHQQQQEQQQDLLSPKPLVKTMSIDSHDALRDYRRNRASMSPETVETMSEASSYHALPDQIREVVQNSGAKTKAEEEELTSPTLESTLSPSELSAEQYKRAHDKFLENSALHEHETIIDTDGTHSDYSDAHNGMDPQVLASLMMSPDILQKRLKQAIGCVEQQKWDQVLFLINANPWLSEMKELTTNQFLLHKLAFFGTGTHPAPMSLSEQLVQKFPAAVHKFDQDGNVPLHLASAAGNVSMIKMLGEAFSSGASIRNEDGMLPLHFAIASFADFDNGRVGEKSNSDFASRPLEAIKTVLKLFPQAVAIADNDGNLPIHVASECLRGGVGADIVYLLMDEAERQLQDPYGARFRNKIKMEELLDDEEGDEEDSQAKANKIAQDLSLMMMDDPDELQCTMVLNDFDETPLLAAIRAYKGWEMIEALVSGPGGRQAALKEDSDKNNALHLLVGEFQDATAAMSILKIVPETAFHRNSEGILPIEMACMVMMPEEVILAIVLVDLPINIEDRDGIKVFKDRGASWAFLTCDCDDHMVHVVEEILSFCSFQQLQELCFLKEDGFEQTIVDRATPKCREAMNRALRFLGRFEFVGDGPLFSDLQTGFKAFDALDFGGNEEGKPVLLECYQNEFDFENRVYTMFDIFLESVFVEEVNVYVEHQDDENASNNNNSAEESQQQRCVAIERPRLTLHDVVQGMTKSGGYDSGNTEKRLKYSAKICSVLKLIGKALRHLHEAGVVHGNLCMETCGKFEDSSWKLMERLGVQPIGKPFDPSRFMNSFPPESLEPLSAENDPEEEEGSTVFDSDRPLVSFAKDIVTDVSIDIWAFGKICYESLVGKALIDFDTKSSESPSDDVVALLQTAEWNVSNMETVFADLLEAGIDESGADMITACLFPSPGDRPADMDEILNNPFWQEIRKHRSPRKGRNRRSGESVSTSVSLLTDVDRYEV